MLDTLHNHCSECPALPPIPLNSVAQGWTVLHFAHVSVVCMEEVCNVAGMLEREPCSPWLTFLS